MDLSTTHVNSMENISAKLSVVRQWYRSEKRIKSSLSPWKDDPLVAPATFVKQFAQPASLFRDCRDTLKWVGGGIVVVASGIWAVVRFFAERKKADEKKNNRVFFLR
jgi:hypothetical protein